MLACFAEIVEGLEQLVLGAAAEEEIHNAKMKLHKHLQVGAHVCTVAPVYRSLCTLFAVWRTGFQ